MRHKKNYIGYSIGCLTVVDEVDKKGTERCFLCKCSICGGLHIRRMSNLKTRGTCGHKFEQPSYKRIYDTWRAMKKRCYLKSNSNYKHYGGRGIAVCDDWLNPDEFYKWSMANGYADNLTIDRIDVNGNYEPSNCRWVDSSTNNYNKRNNILVLYKDGWRTIQYISDKEHISWNTAYYRYVTKLKSPVKYLYGGGRIGGKSN